MTDQAQLTGTDKVLLEVLRNRFQAIVDEMGYVVLRTGHTVFVKETGDFGVALASTQGEVFATPYRVGVHLMVGCPCRTSFTTSRRSLGGWHEGDVFLSNDPVTHRRHGHPLARHLHLEADLRSAVSCFASPGASSTSPTSVDVCLEASRPPTPKPFRRASSIRRSI